MNTSNLYDVIASTYPTHLAASAPILETNGGLTPQQSYDWRKVAGITITYTGQPTLSGRYAIVDAWRDRLLFGAVLRCGSASALSSCSTPFPFNQTTYTYFDADGIAHTMSAPQMQVIELAAQDQEASLEAQLRIGMAGGTPSWPGLTVTVP